MGQKKNERETTVKSNQTAFEIRDRESSVKENADGGFVARNQKDTVFRMLYNDKKELLALYNAESGTHYEDPDELEIVTLESAVYLSMKNDVSMILDTRLTLYEHQSTVCRNMPLRNLFYVAKQYEEMVVMKDIYSGRMIRIPAPKFLVFYNGRQVQPERLEMKLSDAYYTLEESPNLELKVLQLNINPGYNEELKAKCPTLCQYMQYVECIREYERIMPLNEAVQMAVEECIRRGILKDFLLKEKAKVISMSIFEFNQELHDQTMYDDGRADGMADGIELGRAEGKQEGGELKLITLVCRKLRKGKDTEQIAEELEEEPEYIQRICDAAREFAPAYDEDEVFQKLHERDGLADAVRT